MKHELTQRSFARLVFTPASAVSPLDNIERFADTIETAYRIAASLLAGTAREYFPHSRMLDGWIAELESDDIEVVTKAVRSANAMIGCVVHVQPAVMHEMRRPQRAAGRRKQRPVKRPPRRRH